MKTIEINQIIRVVNLLKQVNNQFSALVAETAKEMGVKKTDLMEFINVNSRLFRLENDKKGLRIKTAYPSVSDNPYNQEWLERKQKEYAKTLYVQQWNCYGQLENFYVDEDKCGTYNSTDSYEVRKHLWRNTKEKMEAFIKTGHFFEGTGSTGMWSGKTLPYCLKYDHMIALIDEGWTLDGELPKKVREYQDLRDAGF